jgi:GTP pyrophosphokinase
MLLVKRASKFAEERHEGQFRKGGERFFNHVQRVAEKVWMINPTAAAIAAAYLHDVVEDGRATFAEISGLFGEEVYKIVRLLTRREGESYEIYVMKIAKSGNLAAMQIKMADNEDNLESVGDGAFPPHIEKNLSDRWLWSKDFIGRHIT